MDRISKRGYKIVNKSRSRSRSRSKSKSKSKSKTSLKGRVTKSVIKTKSKSNTKKIAKKGISLADVRKVGAKLNVDFTKLDVKVLQYGMNIELEHGYIDQRTNVTNNNLNMTAKIALAHIIEFPDYYDRLKKLEKDADRFWKNKKKIDPFKNT
jgi:hypothetical protein